MGHALLANFDVLVAGVTHEHAHILPDSLTLLAAFTDTPGRQHVGE